MSATTSPTPSTPAPTGDGDDGLPRNYWLLLGSSGISNLGDGIDAAALPLLAAAITTDPLAFAGVVVAQKLPWLLFALQAGAIADRVDRRRLMVAMQLVRFGLFLVVGLAALGGWATMPLLYVVGFVVGLCETVYDNAAQAIMPAIVERAQLERANGRLFSVELSLNQFVGPPIGGFLFAVTASLPILLDAGTFVASAVLLLFMRGSFGPRARAAAAAARADGPSDGTGGPAELDPTPRIADAPDVANAAPAARRSMTSEIREGLAWLWQHRVLRMLAILLAFMNGASQVGFSTFALYATDPEILGLDETGFGLLLTVAGVGAAIGGVTAGRVVDAIGRTRTLWLMLIAGVAINAVYVVATSWVQVALAAIAFGLTATLWNVVTVSLRQTIIPDDLLGRVNSVYRFLGWGAIPLGGIVGGVVADVYGLRAAWLVGTVLLALPLPFAARVLTRDAIEQARNEAVEPTTAT